MGLLRDLRKAGITAQQIIDLVNGKQPKQAIPPLLGQVRPTQFGGVPVVIVEVTGNATGGGVYEGLYALAAPSTDDLDASEDVNANCFGQFAPPASHAGMGDCYVFNMAEEDLSTHDLTDTTQTVQRFIGVFLGYEKNDGKPCFGINGLDTADCAE